MRIQDILVDGFGIWHDLSVSQLSENMTVFFGRNEAGKTTLMQFLRSVFYGFSPERRTRYLPPVHGGNPGGMLRVVVPGGVFEIRRYGTTSDDPSDLGHVAVHAQNGQRHGSQVLTTLLSGIDETIFNNVFAFGLREVQELGTLDDTDAAEQLYNLTSGLDRVSLVDVMRQLEAARARLLSAGDEPGQLAELLARRERLRRELEQLGSRRERFLQVAAERSRMQREVAELETRVEQLGQESKSVELALRICDTWTRRRELDEQLKRIGAAIDLPDDAVETLERRTNRIDEIRRELEQIKQQRFQIRQEAAIQPINRKLWSHAARIEALSDQSTWIASLETQIRQLQGDAYRLEAELGGQRELPEGEPELPRDRQREVSRTALNALRTPAKAVRDQLRLLKQARQEREEKRREAAELSQRLESRLVEFGQPDLPTAMQQAGQLVAQLRRRIQLQERIDKMLRHRQELDDENGELLEEQILPVNVLAWLGVPFVLGVALILGGLFWSVSAALGWPIAILGLGGWAVAVIMKVMLERSATRELEECQDQLEQLDKQLQQARQERDELDRQLPPGSGALDVRLQEAENRVVALEELLPVDSKRQAAEARSQAAEQQAQQLAEALKQARQRWQSTLRHVGLPESLSPQDIRNLAEGSEQATQVRRQLQVRHEELAARQRELESLNNRISELLVEVDMQPEGDDPQTHLRQMTAALAHQQQLFQRRRVLKQQDRKLKKEASGRVRELRRLRDERERLLSRAGAEDDRTFRQLAARELKRRKLAAERDQANRGIRAALEGRNDQEQIARELETHAGGALQDRWKHLTTQLQDAERRLKQLHQRRGECIQEMRSLAEDKRAAIAELELGCVESQLQQAARRWRVLAAAGLLLENIRRIYETERQPETLAEASKYLEKLTRGQYTRIWTPLTKNVLKVDDSHGNSLPIEVLSRGTREAVFVSLRLALVAAYARRGAVLPLVLDDVMVNFDVERLRAAAVVLRDFARAGHQLLMFTCHEHVVQTFLEAQVEIRHVMRRGAAGEIEPLEFEEHVQEEVEVVQEPQSPAAHAAPAPPPVDDGEAEEAAADIQEEEISEEEDQEEQHEVEAEQEDDTEEEADEEADEEAEEEAEDEAWDEESEASGESWDDEQSWDESGESEEATEADSYELAPDDEQADELDQVVSREADDDDAYDPDDAYQFEPEERSLEDDYEQASPVRPLPPQPAYRIQGEPDSDDVYRLQVDEDEVLRDVSAEFSQMLDELAASESRTARDTKTAWSSPRHWWQD